MEEVDLQTLRIVWMQGLDEYIKKTYYSNCNCNIRTNRRNKNEKKKWEEMDV